MEKSKDRSILRSSINASDKLESSTRENLLANINNFSAEEINLILLSDLAGSSARTSKNIAFFMYLTCVSIFTAAVSILIIISES